MVIFFLSTTANIVIIITEKDYDRMDSFNDLLVIVDKSSLESIPISEKNNAG